MINDDLSNVLNNATLIDGSTPSTGSASVTGTSMTWTVPVLDNPVETVTYRVQVNDDAWGVTLRNHATSPGSSPCVPAEDAARAALLDVPWQDGNCPTTTEHFTPAYSLEKTSDPVSGSEVNPGDTVTYKLTVTNTSQAELAGAVVTDNLSDVLQYATLGTVGAGGSVTGSTLTWTVPTLGPGRWPR